MYKRKKQEKGRENREKKVFADCNRNALVKEKEGEKGKKNACQVQKKELGKREVLAECKKMALGKELFVECKKSKRQRSCLPSF